MPIIRIETEINAPAGICFDLAPSVYAHLESARATREEAVGGVTAGLLKLGDEVTWRARHLGFVQELTSRITRFEPPSYFCDEMIRGPFKHLVHHHRFEAVPDGTCMVDVFDFAAPWGVLGTLAERLVLTSYLRRFLHRRARVLKQLAELQRDEEPSDSNERTG